MDLLTELQDRVGDALGAGTGERPGKKESQELIGTHRSLEGGQAGGRARGKRVKGIWREINTARQRGDHGISSSLNLGAQAQILPPRGRSRNGNTHEQIQKTSIKGSIVPSRPSITPWMCDETGRRPSRGNPDNDTESAGKMEKCSQHRSIEALLQHCCPCLRFARPCCMLCAEAREANRKTVIMHLHFRPLLPRSLDL